MEQQAHTVRSRTSQYTETYSGSHGLPNCNRNEPTYCQPRPESFDERTAFQPFNREAFVHQSLGAPMDFMDVWALEAPPCSSPASTTSSFSQPESGPLSPYTSLLMNDTLEPAFPHVQNTLTTYVAYLTSPQSHWSSSYPEITPWDTQSLAPPFHNAPNHEQRHFHMTAGFSPQQAEASTPPPYPMYTAPLEHSASQDFHFVGSKIESPDSNDGDVDDMSGSDSDDSDSSSSHISSRRASKRPHAKSGVFKLEGWSSNTGVFHDLPDRRHACTVLLGPNHDMPCPKRFQRPEHLRRHIKTVHGLGLGKLHRCKVCDRPFPRTDNLRSHYLTHLRHGKRKGSNEKMDFQRMKKLVGHTDRPLLRWIKSKL
jgi:hypothetical protein